MDIKCTTCRDGAELGEIREKLEHRDAQILKLKALLWDKYIAFKVYKQITNKHAETQVGEIHDLRTRLDDANKRLYWALENPVRIAWNKKGTPGYGAWLTKFQATRAATA
jgi:hypothetical protein